jgi:murein DD-endopeptidase MepM/ murein hydrolase activator NlpD
MTMEQERQAIPVTHTARAFAAGGGCGFLLGAFVVAAVVWQYGNVIGSRAASQAHPPQVPSAVERWGGGIDDAGEGVILQGAHTAPPGAVATSGTKAAVAVPNPSPEAVIGPPPADELADRDLIIPVDGVTDEQLTRSFSHSRNGRLHEAIDILAPRNTAVKAVEDGTIARLFYSKAGGITIYQFDPAEKYTYYYAHLERYADGLAEGQRVRQGQVIGYVGVSGNAPKNTPHLHFAIFRLTADKRWWEGTPVDPYDVLR